MNATQFATAKFRLGRIVATPQALDALEHEDILAAITRHQAGDWGELPKEDCLANDQSLVDGSRIISAYRSTQGVKFWLITEAGRHVTTVLLPQDY